MRLPAGSTGAQGQLDAGRAAAVQIQPPAIASVLGISYKNTGSGDTWVHTGSHGCDTDPDVDWQNAGPWSSWVNEIGSGSGFSRCTGSYVVPIREH